MRIPTALLGPGLALGLAAGQPPVARAAPPEASVAARRAAALRLHDERRHAEAAALLERLAEETGQSELLFDAGQARFAAGHRAHALARWQAYARAPGRSGDDLALVARRIADARALLTPVALVVHVPEDMSEVTVTIRRRYDAVDQQRPPLVVAGLRPSGGTVTAELALDPGVWEVAVAGAEARQRLGGEDERPGPQERAWGEAPRAAGGERRAQPELAGAEARPEPAEGARTIEVQVDRTPRTVELSLRPAPSPAPPPAPPRRVGLTVGLGALAGLALVPGAALVAVGSRRVAARTGACAGDLTDARCVEAGLLAEVQLAGAGGGLLGAGVGLAGAAVTAAFPVARRVWFGELAGGGALLAIGAGWLAAENVAYARTPDDDALYLARTGPWLARRTAAAALLGAGIGLALGATTGLVARRRIALRPTLGLSGVGLQGAF